MTTYGIDAHLLLRHQMTGVPRYTRCLLEHMMRLPLLPDERVVLYAHGPRPADFALSQGWYWQKLSWPFVRGWTHGRLSIAMIMHPPEVLFVPGHEVPCMVRRHTKVVTTLHDVAFRTLPEVYDHASRRRQEWAVQRAIHGATKILVPSAATQRDLGEYYAVADDRIVVTPLAPVLVPEQHQGNVQSLLRQFRLKDGQYFVALGRLEKKKNTAFLIRAFAALRRNIGVHCSLTLVLIGSFGYGEEEIRRAIAEEGVGDSVRLTGYLDDQETSLLLARALCAIFPSRAEGFGIPLLEAMNHGVPVIATHLPVSTEVAEEAAVFVALQDMASFVRAMKQMVFDGSFREKYRAAGYRQVQKFSWDRSAEQTWRVLRNVEKIRSLPNK